MEGNIRKKGDLLTKMEILIQKTEHRTNNHWHLYSRDTRAEPKTRKVIERIIEFLHIPTKTYTTSFLPISRELHVLYKSQPALVIC